MRRLEIFSIWMHLLWYTRRGIEPRVRWSNKIWRAKRIKDFDYV